MLCIAFLGSYTKKETVSGYVTTTEANIRVFPTTAGIISELFVTDGEIVSKGQALARISTSLSTSTDALQSVQTEILESLNSEASSLRSQIDRVRAMATSEERAPALLKRLLRLRDHD